jgi:DNA modification methylase
MMDSWAERTTEADRVRVFHGDSRAVLKAFPDAHFDSVVCDPPYALVSITKRFGADNAAPAQVGASGAYARASAGFMGQKWDTGETAFAVEFWAEVFRVLKPGGHVIAFSGTRTYHRLAVAIEDSGFEIRDMVAYLYGSGFPKSHQLDKKRGDLICGCDTLPYDHAEACQTPPECDLRHLPDSDVSAPVDADDQRGEVLQPGLSEQGASDEGRSQLPAAEVRGRQSGMEGRGDASPPPRKLRQRPLRPVSARPSADGEEGRLHNGTPSGDGPMGRALSDADGDGSPYRPQAAEQPALQSGTVARQPESQAGGTWPLCRGCGKPRVVPGLGTALKPAMEPCVLARKPLDRGNTVAANVLQHGTGALNIDASRIGTGEDKGVWPVTDRPGKTTVLDDGLKEHATTDTTKGRWPANVIHDGSEEVVGAFPETASNNGAGSWRTGVDGACLGHYGETGRSDFAGDSGSAARFFYSAKADAADRCGSKHPTVKPVDLMAYLVRMVTPPGGLTLDPFAGSGTTGVGAMREGMRCVLIEREDAYVEDIVRKLAWARGEGRLTTLEQAKLDTPEAQAKAGGADLPLFGDA